MYIEQSVRGYHRGEYVVRSARFLILMSLDEQITVPCSQCHGFKQHIDTWNLDDDLDGAIIRPCNACNRIPCDACERKGWIYDEKIHETAQKCEKCDGRGDLGASGFVTRWSKEPQIRALVRKVSMHQCGHFMMGRARIGKKTIGLSGSYGGDGLTVSVPRDIWERGLPLPKELHDAWNKGGGWNSAGSEAPLMAEWALANLDKLER
jgi:hypothetical protein